MLDCEIVVGRVEHVGGELLGKRGVDRLQRAADGDRSLLRVDVDPPRARRLEHLLVGALRRSRGSPPSTGGVSMAAETASVTTGRAADTKFEVRASRSVAWSAM